MLSNPLLTTAVFEGMNKKIPVFNPSGRLAAHDSEFHHLLYV